MDMLQSYMHWSLYTVWASTVVGQVSGSQSHSLPLLRGDISRVAGMMVGYT